MEGGRPLFEGDLKVNKTITVIAGVLLFVMVTSATDIPRYEAFLGYTYVRANQFNQNVGLGQAIGGYDMNGGSVQFPSHFNKGLTARLEVGHVDEPPRALVQ